MKAGYSCCFGAGIKAQYVQGNDHEGPQIPHWCFVWEITKTADSGSRQIQQPLVTG